MLKVGNASMYNYEISIECYNELMACPYIILECRDKLITTYYDPFIAWPTTHNCNGRNIIQGSLCERALNDLPPAKIVVSLNISCIYITGPLEEKAKDFLKGPINFHIDRKKDTVTPLDFVYDVIIRAIDNSYKKYSATFKSL